MQDKRSSEWRRMDKLRLTYTTAPKENTRNIRNADKILPNYQEIRENRIITQATTTEQRRNNTRITQEQRGNNSTSDTPAVIHYLLSAYSMLIHNPNNPNNPDDIDNIGHNTRYQPKNADPTHPFLLKNYIYITLSAKFYDICRLFNLSPLRGGI